MIVEAVSDSAKRWYPNSLIAFTSLTFRLERGRLRPGSKHLSTGDANKTPFPGSIRSEFPLEKEL